MSDATAPNPVLDLIGAGLRIKGRDILSCIDLRLQPGEMLGLIGPNGSGKSTLLNVMAGLLAPDRGQVRLAGRPMALLRRRQIARRLALVAQSADTAEPITVREAVELGRTPWLGPLRPWTARDDSCVHAALSAVRMERMAARDWCSLSGGERQRVHIARALAQEPQILLLDEPTNHLDIRHQLGILKLIADLPVTTVVALHDMDHALRCDRVMVLQAGRCVALGPPQQVLTTTLIRRIFAVHADLVAHPGADRPVFAFRHLD